MNPTKQNYDNLVNQSGSTLEDSNLKEGESMLDGSDSYSGSDKSRDQYARQKVDVLTLRHLKGLISLTTKNVTTKTLIEENMCLNYRGGS